ncbi:MAG: type II toxin-antitoxin system PemK/MazF family toxin [Saprospiraceae bacterium]|nr:type II toxin-antitoxin system PemK/MazF family toxin [Saprospiraceae bacterium]
MDLNQYDVVLVNLDPTVGHEIQKTRPCLIISPDEMNRHLRTIMIAPLTTSQREYPTRIKVALNGKEGRIVLDQIRTVDRIRIIRKLDQLQPPVIKEVKNVIQLMLVD